MHAKQLFPDACLMGSLQELKEPDLFNADKPALFLLTKAPTNAEIAFFQKSLRPIVLVAENLPAQNALVVWIKKEGIFIDLCHEAPWQKQKRLEAEIKKVARSIEPQALKALLALPEEDITSEVHKLVTYNPDITMASVSLLVSHTLTSTIWQFLDALLQKDAKKALSCTLGGIDSYFGLMKLVRSQQKNLLLFKKAPPGEKRSTLRHLKDLPFQKIQTAASRFTSEALEESLIKLDKLDFMMRDGLTDENLIHTLLVSYTC